MFSDVYRSYKINYIHTLTGIHQQPQLTYNMANRGLDVFFDIVKRNFAH